jgi:phage shock protein A
VKILGIVDRIKLNARANLNHILNKAENPQKMFDQLLLDMRESVRGVREAVATSIVGVKKLEREISESTEKAAYWEERAVLALRKGNEDLARKALERKRFYVEKERSCKEELEKHQQTVAELKVSLSELEAKLEGLYQRKIDLIKEQARLQRRIAQLSSTRIGPIQYELDIDMTTFDAYDRMVDKVMTLEAQAEALSELSEMGDVEEEFKRLEKETEVETELEAMKSKMRN